MPTAISEFTGLPVDTSSEEYRRECEVRHLVDNFETREQRLRFLYGFTNAEGKKIVRGVADVRGREAADKLRADAMRLYEIRQARAATQEAQQGTNPTRAEP